MEGKMETVHDNPLTTKQQYELLFAALKGNVFDIDAIMASIPNRLHQYRACRNTRYRERSRYDETSELSWHPRGQTPLHMACLEGSCEAVNALCGKWGADPNVTDDSGMTPLQYACLCNRKEVGELLYYRWRASCGNDSETPRKDIFDWTPDHYVFALRSIGVFRGDPSDLRGVSATRAMAIKKDVRECLARFIEENSWRRWMFLFP
jgi:hypothetical protein